MKREGGIRNSAEFIVRVREFWSCYLFIEPGALCTFVRCPTPSPPPLRSAAKVFGSQFLPSPEDATRERESHWCVFPCKSKFFANYRSVNIRRRRPVTGISVCRKVFSSRRKALAIDTLMVFPFYPGKCLLPKASRLAIALMEAANSRSARSLWPVPSRLTSRIREAERRRVDFHALRQRSDRFFWNHTATVPVLAVRVRVSDRVLTLFYGTRERCPFNFILTCKRKLGTRRLFRFQQFRESDRFGYPPRSKLFRLGVCINYTLLFR